MNGARFGFPSYIRPGTYAQNARLLTSFRNVNHMEILFFFNDEESRALFTAEENELIACGSVLTYSVHLSDKTNARDEQVIALTRKLARHYVVHPFTPLSEFLLLVDGWKQKWGDIFLVENLIGIPFDSFAGTSDLKLCLDTGHLLVNGEDPATVFEKYRHRIGEIHLHGLNENGEDHSAVRGDEDWFIRLLPLLKEFQGVINCEVFSENEATTCLAAFRKIKHTMETGR